MASESKRAKTQQYEGEPTNSILQEMDFNHVGDPVHGQPREETLASSGFGLDYSKWQKKENSVQRTNSIGSIPVNRLPVEKVAPPEITKNIRTLFETGQLTDLHTVKKEQINIKDALDAGVFENQPQTRADVIRESDMANNDVVQKGAASSVREKWLSQATQQTVQQKGPINMAEDEGYILENEPIQRTDVVRGDSYSEDPIIQKGHARNLKEKFLTSQDKPKERRQVNLYEEADLHTPAVIENEPTLQRPDVITSQYSSDDVHFAKGKAKNLASYFLTANDETPVQKAPIQIERDSGIVLESQPTYREDVIREHDKEEDVQIERGHARSLAALWQNRKDDYTPKGFSWDIDNADGPTVLENEPEIRTDVVRESSEDTFVPAEPGKAKKLANKFLNPEEKERPRQKIIIERSEEPEVIENEPEQRTDVVRGGFEEDVQVQAGKARKLKDYWASQNDEVKLNKSDKPQWLAEIEEAKALKNEENEENGDHPDYSGDEEEFEIPAAHTKDLRERWIRIQQEEDERLQKEKCPEMVRFTPPRELTPPLLKQAELHQSFQKITLCTDMMTESQTLGTCSSAVNKESVPKGRRISLRQA